ncbi:MAG: hypothetical protein B7C24_15820 [Bacteroidetes bacterium 4572_77]|nr:MAG: hypothetical protein B7C24_15820 [Bacteroidetes bacterium 4572_77]
METSVVGEEIKIPRQTKPFLKGITFRDYQVELINIACSKNRGLIESPTGSGKTVIFLGIMSCYPKLNILVLCHTVTIISQTIEELKKFGFKDIQQFGGGAKIQKPSKRIVISTIQSFVKLNQKDYIDYFDCVIVDEAHAVAKQKSNYSKVLGNLLAPIRLGFSATPLKDPEAKFTYEGLLGKVIGKLTMKEAEKLEILAKPKLKLIKADYPDNLTSIWNYQDTYEKIRENGKLVNGERLKVGAYTAGITENNPRNQQIVGLAQEFSSKKQTVLIFVTHIEHGILLQDEIKNLVGCTVPFVQGSTPQEERDIIKKELLLKKIKICIATVSWMEGLNIPNLCGILLAGGGRSEKQLLQKIGRVLRRTKNKEQAIIIDMLDLGNRHLITHTGDRLAIYSDLGWI